MPDQALIHEPTGTKLEGPPCRGCGARTVKVIYYGLPGVMCGNEACLCADGLAFDVAHFLSLPHNGWMVAYEGSYWPALLEWLRGDRDDE